jgi:hypothetical protein
MMWVSMAPFEQELSAMAIAITQRFR